MELSIERKIEIEREFAKALDYSINQRDYWHKEKDIEEHTNGLNYVNHLIENYSYGNLHQITYDYLENEKDKVK